MERPDVVHVVARLLVAVAIGAVPSAAAGATAADSGSIAVHLVTDPTPPGVDWSYSGIGQSFRLGKTGGSKSVTGLADGTYHLGESGASPGQPQTLTALTCS